MSVYLQIDHMLYSGDKSLQRKKFFPPGEVDNPINLSKDAPFRTHLRIIPEAARARSDSTSMPAGWNSKHKVVRSDGKIASTVLSDGYELDNVMTRKKRVETLMERRNFIPVKNLGKHSQM